MNKKYFIKRAYLENKPVIYFCEVISSKIKFYCKIDKKNNTAVIKFSSNKSQITIDSLKLLGRAIYLAKNKSKKDGDTFN